MRGTLRLMIGALMVAMVGCSGNDRGSADGSSGSGGSENGASGQTGNAGAGGIGGTGAIAGDSGSGGAGGSGATGGDDGSGATNGDAATGGIAGSSGSGATGGDDGSGATGGDGETGGIGGSSGSGGSAPQCSGIPDDLAEATPVDYDEYSPPDGCEIHIIYNDLITSEALYQEHFTCYGPDQTSGIDFNQLHLAIAVGPESSLETQSSASYVVVLHDVLYIGSTGQVYCGGAAPAVSYVAVTVPAGTASSVSSRICLTGSCSDFPP